MDNYRILVVDDDEAIRDAVEIYLRQENMQVLKAANGIEALRILEKEQVHLILMDIMMPRMDGMNATIKIREKLNIPIIMLSAKSEDTDKILGLNIGADDYVTKPFKARELVARLKARLRGRSAAPAPSDVLSVSGIELDETNHTAALHGCELSLTPKEFDCLAELLRAGGAPVSSKALFENVWDEEYTSSSHNAVMVYIRRLRKKLAEVDSSEELIETVWGVGYRIPEKRRG